ncbi:Dabb family protein [Flavilitoribacter nigricans]|nr:Dabb family protein [Flavilitoribacter nigricans]
MKNLLLVAMILFSAVACTSEPESTEENTNLAEAMIEAEPEAEANQKMLRHVVLFKFKDTATEADIKSVEDAFMALPAKIPEIKDLEWGTNNSPEGLAKGFTHCFFLSFESEEDRAVYLPHPDHKAFGAVLGPHLDDVLVVDFWTND